MVTRRPPEAGPPGARRISTSQLQLARHVVTDTAEHLAVGVIHGLAGPGKTFAMRTCTTALATRTRPADRIEVATIAFPARPTMRLLADLLLQTLTGAPPARQANRFYLTAALVRELARAPRLVVVDEAQRLPEECIELLRYLHDHDDTEQHDVDFIVLEQGIDTSSPLGRLFFRIMAALAEFDREAIVEGTLEGLAAARARGRVGGRPPKLTQRQLDQAQHMYDTGEHTVEEIADTFGVARSTLFKHLAAHKDGRDCVMVVYRNTRPGKVDADTNRRYGETGQNEKVQYEADSKWYPIAAARRPKVKGFVSVVNGIVTRVRAVKPHGTWHEDDRGYVEAPLTKPLSPVEIAQQFPTLSLRLDDPRPHARGKIREYLPL